MVPAYHGFEFSLNSPSFYFIIKTYSGPPQTVTSFYLSLIINDKNLFSRMRIGYLCFSQNFITKQQIYYRWYGIYSASFSDYICDGLNGGNNCVRHWNHNFNLPSLNYKVFIFITSEWALRNSDYTLVPEFGIDPINLTQNYIDLIQYTKYLKFLAMDFFILIIDNNLFDSTQHQDLHLNYFKYIWHTPTFISPDIYQIQLDTYVFI